MIQRLKIKSFVLLSLSLLFLPVNSLSFLSPKLSPSLASLLERGEKVNVFISFVGGIESVLVRHRSRHDADKVKEVQNHLEFLRESLIENMISSQSSVNHLLTKRKKSSTYGTFKNFWITNQMFIENADIVILQEIAQDPNVKSIREEGSIYLLEPEFIKNVEERSPSSAINEEIPWGIRKIQAPEAWSLSEKLGGEGIIVASIDTGVRHTHEALRANFLGDHGWYDPSHSQDTPFDVVGHGTHTTGTMAGGKGIGVAPGAKWATCAICSKDLKCPQQYLLDCGQFLVCPTLPDGSQPDCSLTPRVISNAWGTEMEDEWKEMIKVWRAAGIIPVFALGNSGPSCGSTHFPGNHSDVIAVGNTNSDDKLHHRSSVGPTLDRRIKPDIVAPGTDILSASIRGDNKYMVGTGTSMSAPHVAGTIALLLGKRNDLTFEQVKSLIFENADREGLSFYKGACQLTGGNDTDSIHFPNNLFGHGRLNAYKALKNLNP